MTDRNSNLLEPVPFLKEKQKALFEFGKLHQLPASITELINFAEKNNIDVGGFATSTIYEIFNQNHPKNGSIEFHQTLLKIYLGADAWPCELYLDLEEANRDNHPGDFRDFLFQNPNRVKFRPLANSNVNLTYDVEFLSCRLDQSSHKEELSIAISFGSLAVIDEESRFGLQSLGTYQPDEIQIHIEQGFEDDQPFVQRPNRSIDEGTDFFLMDSEEIVLVHRCRELDQAKEQALAAVFGRSQTPWMKYDSVLAEGQQLNIRARCRLPHFVVNEKLLRSESREKDGLEIDRLFVAHLKNKIEREGIPERAHRSQRPLEFDAFNKSYIGERTSWGKK